MPLDWEKVKRRYEGGGELSGSPGSRKFRVVGVDDDAVWIECSLWRKPIARGYLEQAAGLIEAAEMSPRLVDFVEECGVKVTTERRSLMGRVLKDIGYLM